jgi:hypothetical protein
MEFVQNCVSSGTLIPSILFLFISSFSLECIVSFFLSFCPYSQASTSGRLSLRARALARVASSVRWPEAMWRAGCSVSEIATRII